MSSPHQPRFRNNAQSSARSVPLPAQSTVQSCSAAATRWYRVELKRDCTIRSDPGESRWKTHPGTRRVDLSLRAGGLGWFDETAPFKNVRIQCEGTLAAAKRRRGPRNIGPAAPCAGRKDLGTDRAFPPLAAAEKRWQWRCSAQ